MCHFLPVHHLEWHFGPGRRSKYNSTTAYYLRLELPLLYRQSRWKVSREVTPTNKLTLRLVATTLSNLWFLPWISGNVASGKIIPFCTTPWTEVHDILVYWPQTIIVWRFVFIIDIKNKPFHPNIFFLFCYLLKSADLINNPFDTIIHMLYTTAIIISISTVRQYMYKCKKMDRLSCSGKNAFINFWLQLMATRAERHKNYNADPNPHV